MWWVGPHLDPWPRYHTHDGWAYAKPANGSKRCPCRKDPREGDLELEVKMKKRNQVEMMGKFLNNSRPSLYLLKSPGRTLDDWSCQDPTVSSDCCWLTGLQRTTEMAKHFLPYYTAISLLSSLLSSHDCLPLVCLSVCPFLSWGHSHWTWDLL